jgi:hypothetical protein
VAGSSSTSNTVFILLAALVGVPVMEVLRSQTAQRDLWLHANSVALAYSMVVCGAHALPAWSASNPLRACFARQHCTCLERCLARRLAHLYSFYRTYANGVLPIPHLR